jgi:transketolase
VRALIRETQRDPRIMLITADLGFGALEPYEHEFPDNFLNVGVSEQNMIGVAAGLAHSGRLPFVYSIANFPTFRCLEQIRLDVCYHKLPVTVVSVGAGLSYGTLGYTHHAVEDIAIMRSLPEIRIFSPSGSRGVSSSVRHILGSPGPSYIRLSKGATDQDGATDVPALESVRLRKQGRRVVIFTTGEITNDVVEWSKRSTSVFSECSIAEVQQVKPLDLSGFLEEIEGIVTVEEHSLTGGLSGAVMEYLRDHSISLPILSLGLPDKISHDVGSRSHLLEIAGLSAPEVDTRIASFFLKNLPNGS